MVLSEFYGRPVTQKVGEALKQVTEAIIGDRDLQSIEKSKALELLSVVATEGAAPKERRRGEAMRVLLRDIASLLSGSAALTRLWESAGPLIAGLFQ
jgi:hypothetical protein